jgi:hypothetical protein
VLFPSDAAGDGELSSLKEANTDLNILTNLTHPLK